MAKATKAKIKKGEYNELGIAPRDLTVQQRLDLFAKKKKELSNDWRVVKENETEELVPFNSLTLDHGLRLYGLARNGTVYQLHGDEGAGKSTLGYAINREYQKATGEAVAIFDFERTTKSWYLRAMGIDESRAFVKRPDSIEDAIKNTVDLIGQGVRLFTFDSIPRMRSKVEASEIKNGKAFGVQPGTHARAIQQFYDILLPYIAEADGALLMINQTRSRIEMSQEAKSAAAGYATVTNLNYSLPGGRANRYAISGMLELKTEKAYRPGKHEDPFILEAEAQRGEEYLANEVRVRSLKNKITGTGYREGRIWIRPGLGTDENISIRQWGRDLGMITNHGKRYFVGNSIDDAIKVYDSKDDAIEDLVDNPNEEVLGALKEAIIKRMYDDPSIGALQVDEDTQRYLAGEQEYAADQENHIPSSMMPVSVDEELE
jgi:RecA/RadA recombinase